MSETYREFLEMSDDELIERHDRRASNTMVGTGHYLDELTRRRQERNTEQIMRMTVVMAVLTGVITIATLVYVGVAICDVFFKC